jgi:hypothetical protein
MLCEQPEAMAQQRADYVRKQTDNQMTAVEHDLERSQVPGQPISRDHQSAVTARQVQAADDD